jgi:hypothetical protein
LKKRGASQKKNKRQRLLCSTKKKEEEEVEFFFSINFIALAIVDLLQELHCRPLTTLLEKQVEQRRGEARSRKKEVREELDDGDVEAVEVHVRVRRRLRRRVCRGALTLLLYSAFSFSADLTLTEPLIDVFVAHRSRRVGAVDSHNEQRE